ncbi:hypothetical protein M1O57_02050 [Dehalococcoidia bacterium]|nr:hypothetical protein [Dehalococcoidia bacterium]
MKEEPINKFLAHDQTRLEPPLVWLGLRPTWSPAIQNIGAKSGQILAGRYQFEGATYFYLSAGNNGLIE